MVLLASMMTVVIMKQNKFENKKIGEIQLQTINSYKNAEKTLFLIDQAGKYSIYKTIFELAENGGKYSVSEGCGDYLGYPIFYDRDTPCYPTDVENDFILTYNENLDSMLAGITAPGSFSYQIMDTNPLNIVGASREMLEFQISYISEKSTEKTQVCSVAELKEIPDTIICSASSQTSSCELGIETLQKLEQAQQIATAKGYQLQVTSAYRTYEQQAELRRTKGEMAAEPSCNAPHITGKAVDVVLYGQRYMTSKGNSVSNMNLGERKELENIMCQAGFVRYGNSEGTKGEFWHYEYGTNRWERGKTAGVCAII
jgi:D-alanyl-D-alanine dipeptidase